jgi:type I restriction enzyme S subunit
LGEISLLTAGNPAPQGEKYFTNGVYPFVRVQDMGNLGNDIYISDTKDHINERAVEKLRLFTQGSVLFTKSGMSTLLNQRAILPGDMYVVSHIGVSIPLGKIPSKYIYYWLKTVDFKDLTHATTLPSLPLPKVKGIFFPLPPLPEQQRIVSKMRSFLPTRCRN